MSQSLVKVEDSRAVQSSAAGLSQSHTGLAMVLAAPVAL
jgi:hypothetical protein